MSGQPLLPPILYHSASLAEIANREEVDPRHGLIDATDANMLRATYLDGWTFIDQMPADAVQLVDYVPVAELAIEWGVRWPMPDGVWPVEEAPDRERAEKVARLNGGHVVQREVRRGQWKPVTS